MGSPASTPLGGIGEDEEAEYEGSWGRASSAELASDYGSYSSERKSSRGQSLSGRISSFFTTSNPMRGDSTASPRSPSRGPSLIALFRSNPMAQNPMASRGNHADSSGVNSGGFASTNIPRAGGAGMGPSSAMRSTGAKGEKHLSINSDMGVSHAL